MTVPSRLTALLSGLRSLRWIAHAEVVVRHHQARLGGELAASVTVQAALALVPLAVLGLILVRSLVQGLPEGVPTGLADADTPTRTAGTLLDAFLPGLSETLLPVVSSARPATSAATVLAGVAALLVGVGWVRSVRRAVRSMLSQPAGPPNVLREKGLDLLVLVRVVGAVGVAALVAVVGRLVIHLLLDRSAPAHVGTAMDVGTAVLGAGTALLVTFVVLRSVALPGTLSRRRALEGALVATVGTELAKWLFLYYTHLTSARTSLYGTFAVLAGLLVWVSLVSRVFVLSAAWAAVPLPPRPLPPADPTVPAPRAEEVPSQGREVVVEAPVPAPGRSPGDPLP